jgi:hypothetical protein
MNINDKFYLCGANLYEFFVTQSIIDEKVVAVCGVLSSSRFAGKKTSLRWRSPKQSRENTAA